MIDTGFMDAKELRSVGEQVAKAIFENRHVEAVIFQMGRIVSYLESEQAKRKELGDQMNELKDLLVGTTEKPGIGERLRLIEARSARNGKLLVSVLGSVITMIVVQVLKLLK